MDAKTKKWLMIGGGAAAVYLLVVRRPSPPRAVAAGSRGPFATAVGPAGQTALDRIIGGVGSAIRSITGAERGQLAALRPGGAPARRPSGPVARGPLSPFTVVAGRGCVDTRTNRVVSAERCT